MVVENKREIIVVIGAGRTGSSLLVNVLLEMGMLRKGEYALANEQNPEGFFEDKDILAVHKKIFDDFGAHPMLPVPDELLEMKSIRKYRRELIDIIESRVSDAGNSVWGFKDPRVSGLIPLWRRVFSMANVVPKYILTVREPSSVITSMSRQNDNGDEFAEMAWLTRNIESIYQTGGNCFIVNYEEWFGDRASELAQSLARYTGLDTDLDNKKISDILEKLIKSNLNRSQYGHSVVRNRYTQQLYDVLKDCHGEEFDREKLMRTASDCRKAVSEFDGWLLFSQKYYQLFAKNALPEKDSYQKMKSRNEQLKDEKKELSVENRRIHAELEKAVMRQNTVLKEAKDCRDRLENARIKAQDDRKKLQNIRKSRSYIIGMEVVGAFRKPGIKTIMLPYTILKHAISIITGRGK